MEKKLTAPSIEEQKKILYCPTNVEDVQLLVMDQITKLCEMRVHVMFVVNTMSSKELDFMKDEVLKNWDKFRYSLNESMDYLMTIACRLEELRVSKNICIEPFGKEASHE